MVQYFGCYDFNKEWLLVEMVLNVSSSEIEWDAIVVPNDELDEEDWQCPYMEQYLNEDGTEKICETYDEPEKAVKPCRVAFFIYKDEAQTLRTPYGEFDLSKPRNLPKRLKHIITFDDEPAIENAEINEEIQKEMKKRIALSGVLLSVVLWILGILNVLDLWQIRQFFGTFFWCCFPISVIFQSVALIFSLRNQNKKLIALNSILFIANVVIALLSFLVL